MKKNNLKKGLVSTVTTLVAVGAASTIALAADVDYTIQKNDNLWRIAVDYYGDGNKYMDIYNANKDVLASPTSIAVGTNIVLADVLNANGTATQGQGVVTATVNPTIQTPATVTTTVTPSQDTYVVQKGDTLGEIATRFLGSSIKYKELYEYNKDILGSANRIYVGQVIKLTSTAVRPAIQATTVVPTTVAPTTVAPTTNTLGNTYTIQAGDTLWNISARSYGNGKHFNAIYEANKGILKSATQLSIGQVITIPSL